MQRYFPLEEYEARWDRLDAELERRGLTHAVVWGRSGGTYERAGDVLYLTNYYGTHSGQGLDTPISTARGFAGVLYERGVGPHLVADEPDPNADLLATTHLEWSTNTIDATAQALRRRGISGPVAFVGSDFFPIKYWDAFKQATSTVEWRFEDDLIRVLRRTKSARELECFRRGGEIVSRALTRLIEGLIAGMTESEAAGEAAREVVRGGGHIHMLPCSHGDLIHYFARDPLNGYSDEAPRPGELVRGWVYGPMFQGYWLDPGRTAVAGRAPSDAQRELIETCTGIVQQLLERIKPGVRVGDVARYGEQLLADAGAVKDQAAEKWPHFGHGVGLFFEKPYVSTVMGTADETFQEDEVYGIEAFVTWPGVGSAGFEENCIIGRDGVELLTTTPTTWW